MSENGMSAVPQDDRIPVQVSDTVVRGTVTPTYPVAQFPHTPTGGDAIANGFVYRGKAIPALRNKLLFSDITTGRFWYAEIAEVLAADDNDPATVAPIHEVDSNLRQLVEESYRSRGGKTPALPGFARVSGPGRVDVRLASDEEGELYVLTKADGMIRKVVGAPVSARPAAVARGTISHPTGKQWAGPFVSAVNRGRQEGLRHLLRRLPRERGARRGPRRDRDLDYPGTESQTAARPHRHAVGSRINRR